MSEIAPAREIGITYINEHKNKYLWKIFEFSNLKLRFDCSINRQYVGCPIENFKGIIQSPEFSIGLKDLKWSLVMFRLCRSTEENYWDNFLGFKFICSNKINLCFDVKVVLEIFDGKTGELIARLEKLGPVKICDSSPEHFRILSPPNANWIKPLISYDEIHVLCEHTISDPINDSNSIRYINQDVKMNQFIVNALKKQWENELFCDFELIAPCGRKLLAHRCILAAHSPVFDAMLKNDMSEKQNLKVEIPDISYEALEVMLSFFYSGYVDKLDHKLVIDVLSAAEKYQVEDLKKECQNFLKNTITLENVLQSLKLSKIFGMVDLEMEANQFISLNAKDI